MKKHQNGFTAIEGLLIAIIVLMVGFIGYYVYHSQQQANKTLNAAQADNITTAATKKSSAGNSSEATYLDIKELGVKFQLSSKISDAYYVKADGYYYFSVHSFDSNPDLSGCAASAGEASGILALIVAKPGEAGADPAGDPWTADSIKQADLKQAGDSYYGFQGGNAPCFDPTSANAAADENTVSDIKAAFVAAEPTFTKD